MIEVQVGREDEVDATSIQPGLRKRVIQMPEPIDSIDREALRVILSRSPRQ